MENLAYTCVPRSTLNDPVYGQRSKDRGPRAERNFVLQMAEFEQRVRTKLPVSTCISLQYHLPMVYEQTG